MHIHANAICKVICETHRVGTAKCCKVASHAASYEPLDERKRDAISYPCKDGQGHHMLPEPSS